MRMASRSSSLLVRANQLLLMTKRRHVVGLCCIKPSNSIPSFKLMMTTNIKPKSSSVNYSRDNITLVPASNKSNNNEAQIIENSYESNRRGILKTLMINWLKVPTAVSLFFLMMMMMITITSRRRNMAWALPGGGGHPLSSSTSQSMGDQKTTNYTYIVVETPEFVRSLLTSSSNHDVKEDCSARKTLSYKDIGEIFFVYVATPIFALVILRWLPNVDAMEFEKRVIKLQVGLNMDSLGFENCFNRIAQSAADSSKPEMFQGGDFYKDMLRETTEALLDNLSCCMAACHSEEVKYKKSEARAHFGPLLEEERMKSDFHFDYSNTKERNTYMVVTILVACTNVAFNYLPKSISSKKDLKKALEKINNISGIGDILRACVLWTPRKANQVISLDKLHKIYPQLCEIN